RDEDAPATVNK
ncbi:unnamed protein product, partial [Rotaria sp. Silwood1]